MKSLILKIAVALCTFTVGLASAYLVLLVAVTPNAELMEAVIPPLDICESARERAKSASATWYATYRVYGGCLEGKKICKPAPVYSQEAVYRRVSGTVTVQLLVSASGSVISAHAIEGPKLLRKAAEDAAREAVFSPNMLGGEPVNVAGFISYEFVLPPPNSAQQP